MDSDEDSFAVEDDTSEAGRDSASESSSADEAIHLEGNEAGDEGVEKTPEDLLRKCTDLSFDSSGEGSEREPDDDEMMAVDDQLAQLFRNRIKGKKNKGSYSPRTLVVRPC
jgi:DNA polymerase phi